ncbi:MAG TPA: fasciclin domain-containing protein [Paludibacter sp.]|nr:fasciclin domain-containing protein [Paludibacter sp.]
MKNNICNIALVRHFKYKLVLVAIAAFLFSACDSDQIDKGSLYTFTDNMLGQYLKDRPAEYSEFVTLLDTTKVMGLLNAYGQYTCFVPDNEAMKNFYADMGRKSLADFPMDSLKIIAYDHIISGAIYSLADFVDNGSFPMLSMSGRPILTGFTTAGGGFIKTSSTDENGKIRIDSSLVRDKNILVHNGIIHKISRVIKPVRVGIAGVIAQDSLFTLFNQALIATGLADSLYRDEDESYDPNKYESLIGLKAEAKQWYYDVVPPTRKYGYTLLMESNATMEANGIRNLADLEAYAASVYNQVYPEDAADKDPQSRTNSLNRFVAYHIITKRLSSEHFINRYDTDHMIKLVGSDMYEYIETMCPNTLMEVKKDRLMSGANLFNYCRETGKSLQLGGYVNKTANNGYYHEINGMLVYSADVVNELTTKRLRFDSSSFFDELTNNNMRGLGTVYSATQQNINFQLPRGYISRISSSEQTVVRYLTCYDKFQNYEGDEIYLNATSGNLFDFTVLTPPIPAGTYEVRFGYLTNGKRGVAQLYIDDKPCGVPLNLNTESSDASIGFVAPEVSRDDWDGYENDKMMRNRGYMKGPASYKVPSPGWSSGKNARYSPQILRRIMGTYTWNSDGHHKFSVKALSGGEFMFDYLEFVPTSSIETEDIY